MRVLVFVLIVVPLAGFAASAGRGAGSQGASQGSGKSMKAGSGSRGGGTGGRLDHRKVPPLASDRKISEQDCTKPIDWTAGNLKCR